MPEVEPVPAMKHCSGTGALLANHHTYLGEVAYALTIGEAPHGGLALAGEFAFVTAPLDIGDYAQLSLELAAGDWLAIDITYYDPTQNIYSFAGRERYREHGA